MNFVADKTACFLRPDDDTCFGSLFALLYSSFHGASQEDSQERTWRDVLRRMQAVLEENKFSQVTEHPSFERICDACMCHTFFLW